MHSRDMMPISFSNGSMNDPSENTTTARHEIINKLIQYKVTLPTAANARALITTKQKQDDAATVSVIDAAVANLGVTVSQPIPTVVRPIGYSLIPPSSSTIPTPHPRRAVSPILLPSGRAQNPNKRKSSSHSDHAPSWICSNPECGLRGDLEIDHSVGRGERLAFRT